MSSKAFMYAETVLVLVAVSLPVHYLGGLDWPWAIGVGAMTSMVVRWLIHSGVVARPRKRPLPGGR